MCELTIAIVTKDRSDILEKTLDRLSEQNLTEHVLVLDGSSSSSSEEVCKNLEVEHYYQTSSGMTSARNEALEKCNTKYIVFIDDDVLVSDSWFNTLEEITLSEDIAGATGKLENESLEFSGLSNIIRIVLFGGKSSFGNIKNNGVINGDFFYDDVKEVDHMPGCNMAYKVSLLEEVGGFEEDYDVGSSYREDTVASYKVAQHGKVIYHQNVSVNHLKSEEGRNEKNRLFYNTYLTRYFLHDQNIVSGWKNKLEHVLITACRHGYYLSRSLLNKDLRYTYYLKGEVRGFIDFVVYDKRPVKYDL